MMQSTSVIYNDTMECLPVAQVHVMIIISDTRIHIQPRYSATYQAN